MINAPHIFVSCIACVFPDGREFTVRGECEGNIATEPEGSGGFGYDPLFVSDHGCFGTMPQEEKNRISHRAAAAKLFKEEIKSIYNRGDNLCLTADKERN